MILTQKDLDYFNDKRNYRAHFCHHLGCGCPSNGPRWKQYDEWIRLGRPYTMDQVMVEKEVKYKSHKDFVCDKYTLGFFIILFFILFSLCIKN